MKCPHCKKEVNIGKLLSTIKSPAKQKASRENGRKGGRPRGSKNKIKKCLH